jgi:hypothetical protein
MPSLIRKTTAKTTRKTGVKTPAKAKPGAAPAEPRLSRLRRPKELPAADW